MKLQTTEYIIEVITPKRFEPSFVASLEGYNWRAQASLIVYLLVYANLVMISINIIGAM